MDDDAALEDFLDALMVRLVDPLIPQLGDVYHDEDVAKQVEALAWLYNHELRAAFPHLPFLDSTLFCKKVALLRINLAAYLSLGGGEQTVTEKRIHEACCNAAAKEMEGNDNSFPVSRISVLLLDSTHKSCLLMQSLRTVSIWSFIEKDVDKGDIGQTHSTEDNAKLETELLQMAFLAVKEQTGISKDSLQVESGFHAARCMSQSCSNTRLYTITCKGPVQLTTCLGLDAAWLPLADALSRARDPLVEISSFMGPIPKTGIDYFHLRPFSDYIGNIISSAKPLTTNSADFASDENKSLEDQNVDMQEAEAPPHNEVISHGSMNEGAHFSTGGLRMGGKANDGNEKDHGNKLTPKKERHNLMKETEGQPHNELIPYGSMNDGACLTTHGSKTSGNANDDVGKDHGNKLTPNNGKNAKDDEEKDHGNKLVPNKEKNNLMKVKPGESKMGSRVNDGKKDLGNKPDELTSEACLHTKLKLGGSTVSCNVNDDGKKDPGNKLISNKEQNNSVKETDRELHGKGSSYLDTGVKACKTKPGGSKKDSRLNKKDQDVGRDNVVQVQAPCTNEGNGLPLGNVSHASKNQNRHQSVQRCAEQPKNVWEEGPEFPSVKGQPLDNSQNYEGDQLDHLRAKRSVLFQKLFDVTTEYEKHSESLYKDIALIDSKIRLCLQGASDTTTMAAANMEYSPMLKRQKISKDIVYSLHEPIQELQQICRKNSWPDPRYEISSMPFKSTQYMYNVTVHVCGIGFELSEKGEPSDDSIKAKESAASCMLGRLHILRAKSQREFPS